jgi:hypothetical protein
MKRSKAVGLTVAVASVLGTIALLFFIYLVNRAVESPHAFQAAASTSDACRPCHQSLYDSYVKTGHYLTSTVASETTVMGDFGEGRNVARTPVPELQFVMERKRGGFYQTAMYTKDSTQTFTRPMQIVVGSGERAQTYTFWEGDRLFQLPGMYFTPEATWTLGPGYENWIATWEALPKKSPGMLYQRPISGRCIECHAATAVPVGGPARFRFRPASFEVGISCANCHGPGARHIAFHEQNSEEQEGQHIVNPANLSRSQQMSSCALCHAGQGIPKTPPLSFRPGDEISQHLFYLKAEQKKLSVHAGQVPFLQESRCFEESGDMTCSTCHNVHEDQTDQTAMFSRKCLTCHEQSHTEEPELAQGDRCTQCHMPDQQASNLPVFHEGEEWFLSMANHRIGIF